MRKYFLRFLVLISVAAPFLASGATPLTVSATAASVSGAPCGLRSIPIGLSTVGPLPIAENFPTAFKAATGAPGIDSESGSQPNAPPATSGTQFAVVFADIPSGMTFSVPLSITSTGGGRAVLVTAEGGVIPVVSSVLVSGVPVVAITAQQAVFYNVVAANPSLSETFQLPVFVNTLAGTVIATQPSYTVELAPRASTQPTAVPRFVSNPVPKPVFVVADCIATAFTFPFQGTAPAPQTIALTGPAGGQFTVVSGASWIVVSPTSGTLPASITITINSSGLAPGNYLEYVSIASASAISPSSIAVQLSIAGPPQVAVAPTALAFGSGGSQTLAVSGLPAGTSFQAVAFGAPWLSVTQAGDGNSGSITVIADPGTLALGVYRGAVQVTSGSSSATIPVTLNLSASNTLALSPDSLSFVIQLGGDPVTKSVSLTPSAGAPPFSIVSNAPWLTVTPAGGAGPAIISVTANASGLAAGSYTATLSVQFGGGPAIQFPVHLQVGSVLTPVLSAVTDGVSFQGAAVSPGMFISLFGSGLGPQTGLGGAINSEGSFADEVGDTRVLADGVACPLVFVSSGQVNALLPFGLGMQTSTLVQVEYKGVLSNGIAVPVQAATPGLFTANGSGSGAIAALNQDGTLNLATNPAQGGSIVVLFGAGAGLFSPQQPDGALAAAPFPALVLPVSITIGGLPAALNYAGVAPGEVYGVLQVNAVVPTGLSAGPQPVIISAGSFQGQQSVTVYIK